MRGPKLCPPSHIQRPWVGVCGCVGGCDISQSLLTWTSHSAVPDKQLWPLLKVFALGQEASSGPQVLALNAKTVQDGLPSHFKKP